MAYYRLNAENNNSMTHVNTTLLATAILEEGGDDD